MIHPRRTSEQSDILFPSSSRVHRIHLHPIFASAQTAYLRSAHQICNRLWNHWFWLPGTGLVSNLEHSSSTEGAFHQIESNCVPREPPPFLLPYLYCSTTLTSGTGNSSHTVGLVTGFGLCSFCSVLPCATSIFDFLRYSQRDPWIRIQAHSFGVHLTFSPRGVSTATNSRRLQCPGRRCRR